LPEPLEPQLLRPENADQLRDAMASAAGSHHATELVGNNSKRLMAGEAVRPELRISTVRMKRILQYEPRDLTISVEAGLPFAELNAELAKHGQMIPLDGPYVESATVGGMVAANISGSRRRLYGTARDLVIGMRFATLDGKLVESGGMVVKNVAGLDMAKLLIGSFGTLAAIASVNFKLTPRPKASRTALFSFDDPKAALEIRSTFLRGVLAPIAVDVLNPILSGQLASAFGTKGYVLAVMFAGGEAVMERSLREASAIAPCRPLSLEEEPRFWTALGQLTPHFLDKFPEGSVVRVSAKLADVAAVLETLDAPGHALAATGIVRGWFSRPQAASRWMETANQKGWTAVAEFSAGTARQLLRLWPNPGGDFEIMKGIKKMFDPGNLLNRGRYYGQF
jgi:glycolate oxidase FAD binding subunit